MNSDCALFKTKKKIFQRIRMEGVILQVGLISGVIFFKQQRPGGSVFRWGMGQLLTGGSRLLFHFGINDSHQRGRERHSKQPCEVRFAASAACAC